MKKLLLSATLLFSCRLFAIQPELEQLSLERDEAGHFSPLISARMYWFDNKKGYSELNFSTTNSLNTDTLGNTDSSRTSNSSSQTDLQLNLYTHRFKFLDYDFSIGGVVNHLNIQNTEFGYFTLTESSALPSNLRGQWISFEHLTNITVLQPALNIELMSSSLHENNHQPISWRFTGLFFLANTLSLDQEIRIKPIVDTTGKKSASEGQAFSYQFNFELIYHTGMFADLKFNIFVNNLPLKYQLQQLSYDQAGEVFDFKAGQVDIEEQTTRLEFKVLFNNISLIKNMPVYVGYGLEKTSVTDKINNEQTEDEVGLLLFGFSSSF